jgi:hypothetical protein
MSLSAIIQRGDRQSLGNLEQVKTQLNKAFPGTQFKFVRDGSVTRPSGFNLASLLFRLFKARYPYWEGSFEADEFIAVFNLGEGPTVEAVRVMLYGRETTSAAPYFTILSEQTGWQTKFPKL